MFKAIKGKLFGDGPSASTEANLIESAALVAKGGELLDQGKPGQATKCLQQALELTPQDANALVKLGRALIDQGRHEEALTRLEQAVALNPTLADAFYFLGISNNDLGDKKAAIINCANSLKLKPNFVPCRLFLCRLFVEAGKNDAAKALIQAGIALTPDVAELHCYFGNLLTTPQTLNAAVASYQSALSLRPDYPEALGGLANALHFSGQFDAAVNTYEKAIALKSNCPGIYCSLAATLLAQGKIDGVIECYDKALAVDPNFALARCGLGNALRIQGKLALAISQYRKAVSSDPKHVDAWLRLGDAFLAGGQYTDAIESFKQGIKLDERRLFAHNGLGVALKQAGRYAEAVGCLQKAVQLAPNNADLHTTLGSIFSNQSLHDAALESYKTALVLAPNLAVAQSNVLFTVNYHPDLTAEQVFAHYREYDERSGLPLRSRWAGHCNSRSPARRLRIGYVSPDFRHHSVRHFLEPLLAHHDKTCVEVYAYAELNQTDATTARYMAWADHWVPTLGMTDDALADRVRADGIDVLVDLAGHTEHNRLGVFARKPAPVSVSWLGFGYTTGLSAIDYYLTDELCAPPGCESLFSEQPWRLKRPAYVYRPAQNMGQVSALPALKQTRVTFGTLTRAVRINQRTVRVWARILKRVPSSHLRVDSMSYQDVSMRASLTDQFAAHGIAPDRLELGFHSPPWDVLRGMDIGLDCFPHNSGTTLFETLYMGVPYVTLADRPSVGRLGSSILHGLGHPEWIAKTEDEYVEIAVALASDLGALAELRSGLRAQMEASPLRDEAGFAREIERAYKEMFARWASGSTMPSVLGSLSPRLDATAIDSADAYYRLGTTCKECGDTNAAIANCARALELKPDFTPCRLFLCRLLVEAGRHDDAKALIQAGIELTPDVADFHFYLGNLLTTPQTLDAAVASFRTALSLRADYPEALGGMANALHWMGQFDAAVESYEKAIALKSDYPGVYCSLAQTLVAQGKLDAAVECYRKALAIDLNSVPALSRLGRILFNKGQTTEAIDILQKALKIDKNNAEANNNLGCVFQGLNLHAQAADCFRKVLRIAPHTAEAHVNLGTALQKQSLHNAALESYKKALALKPELIEARSSLLFTVNYHPDLSAEQVFAAYREYDQCLGIPLRSRWIDHGNSRETNRRLRVGYVSPDFHHHSVRHFLEPLLAHHEKNCVQVYAYAELMLEDAMTERYRSYVDQWVPTTGMTDDALAERIRADRIDILVDLAGHTEFNRLNVFARKPAPVSVSWLGFGYTTGLSAIDYFLSDEVCVPAGSEPLFSEQPWRLATPAYVYRPAEGMGPVGALPAAERGHVTFGTLTRAVRINHRTIRVWAQILERLPSARLRVDSGDYREASMRLSLTDKFAAHGIAPERLELGCQSPPWDVLRAMDIGLDCFPHNSGTTLFETLYMGLPYVTLADRPSVGRLGSSILHGIGHPEWIAKTEDEYVEIAVALASDLDALTALRSGLRAEMEASPLRDEVGFARKMEGAYREMFRRWAEDSTTQ